MGNRSKPRWITGALLALAGCTTEPTLVASNCEDPDACGKAEPLKLDAVDILMVIDDSPSTASSAQLLKQELPRMLNAITTGDGEEGGFPPAQSVHVATITTDLGVGVENSVPGCSAHGRDGVFVKPGEVGLSCDVSYPGYLAFNAAPAAVATVDTVACIPLVFPSTDPMSGSTTTGCGYEQPLEAMLKALSPTTGHGSGQNAGFLRPNSLLVVIVVTDEDDCSTADGTIFGHSTDELREQPVNVRCALNRDKLFDVKKYVDGLKSLRPGNDDVIFAVLAGIPHDYVKDELREKYDFTSPQSVADYYDALLEDPRMKEVVRGSVLPFITPSCSIVNAGDQRPSDAMPPRRLVEVAKGFGVNSYVGSICSGQDFGVNTGRIIRAIGERLTGANGS